MRFKYHLHGFEQILTHLVERFALRIRAGQFGDVADVAALLCLFLDRSQL